MSDAVAPMESATCFHLLTIRTIVTTRSIFTRQDSAAADRRPRRPRGR